MALLEFSRVEFGYSDERIITEASGALQAGDITGLVGANGGGKTTLLRLLTGGLSPESGTIQRARQARISYVSQGSQGDDSAELYSFVRQGRQDLVRLEQRLRQLEERIAAAPGNDTAVRELGEAHAQFAALGGHTWDTEVQRLLSGLQFSGGYNQQLGTLSGGQRQKACLARALLSDSNLLILDEPTNHLDLDAQAFLVDYLRQLGSDAAVLLVSHDRWLLRQLARAVWELEDGVLYRYSFGYDKYVPARDLRRQQARETWQKQQEHIARTEDYIRRNIAGQNTKQAQGRRTLLARMERMDKPAQDPQLSFILKPRLRTGEYLLEVEDLTFGYNGEGGAAGGELHVHAGHSGLELNPPLERARGKAVAGNRVVDDLSFTLLRGERLGIIGPNGCGKSTLLKLLGKQLTPQRGMVAWGSNAELGVFYQDSADLLPGRDLLAEIRSVEPGMADGEARGYLARFGFSGDDVLADAGTLSGGERSRLSLAKIFRSRPNVLLLDEPTNHLDIYAREALEQFVSAWEGSLLLVTHDRQLLERLCDRLIVYKRDGSAEFFRGGYSDYLTWRQRQAEAAQGEGGGADPARRPGGSEPAGDPGRPETLSVYDIELLAKQARTSPRGYCGKQRERVAARMHQLEDDIAELEQQVDRLHSQQREADEGQDFVKLQQLQEQIDGLNSRIEETFGKLEPLAEAEAAWHRLSDGAAGG